MAGGRSFAAVCMTKCFNWKHAGQRNEICNWTKDLYFSRLLWKGTMFRRKRCLVRQNHVQCSEIQLIFRSTISLTSVKAGGKLTIIFDLFFYPEHGNMFPPNFTWTFVICTDLYPKRFKGNSEVISKAISVTGGRGPFAGGVPERQHSTAYKWSMNCFVSAVFCHCDFTA
jgi:hypothetical protein